METFINPFTCLGRSAMVFETLGYMYESCYNGVLMYLDDRENTRGTHTYEKSEKYTDRRNVTSNLVTSAINTIKDDYHELRTNPKRYFDAAWDKGMLWVFLGGGILSGGSIPLIGVTVAAGFATPFIRDTIERLAVKDYGEYSRVKTLLGTQISNGIKEDYETSVAESMSTYCLDKSEEFRDSLYDYAYHKLERKNKDNEDINIDEITNEIVNTTMNEMSSNLGKGLAETSSKAITRNISTAIANSWTNDHEIYDSFYLRRDAQYSQSAEEAIEQAHFGADRNVFEKVKENVLTIAEKYSDVVGIKNMALNFARKGYRQSRALLDDINIVKELTSVLSEEERKQNLYTVVTNTLDQYSFLYSVIFANPKDRNFNRISEYILSPHGEEELEEDITLEEEARLFAQSFVGNEYDHIDEDAANGYETSIKIHVGTAGLYDLHHAIEQSLDDYKVVIEKMVEDDAISLIDWVRFDLCAYPEKKTDTNFHKLLATASSYSIAALMNQKDSDAIARGQIARNILEKSAEFVYYTSQLKAEGHVEDKEKINHWMGLFDALHNDIKEIK